MLINSILRINHIRKHIRIFSHWHRLKRYIKISLISKSFTLSISYYPGSIYFRFGDKIILWEIIIPTNYCYGMICTIFYSIYLYWFVLWSSVTIIAIKVICLGFRIIVFHISIWKSFISIMSHIHISNNTAIFSYSFLYL